MIETKVNVVVVVTAAAAAATTTMTVVVVIVLSSSSSTTAATTVAFGRMNNNNNTNENRQIFQILSHSCTCVWRMQNKWMCDSVWSFFSVSFSRNVDDAKICICMKRRIICSVTYTYLHSLCRYSVHAELIKLKLRWIQKQTHARVEHIIFRFPLTRVSLRAATTYTRKNNLLLFEPNIVHF